MNAVPGMPQTQAARDLLYALEFVQNYDPLDVLDAAEELARREGAVRLDGGHVQRALVALAPKAALPEAQTIEQRRGLEEMAKEKSRD